MTKLQNTLYAKYILEREGSEILDQDYGFVIFKIHEKECFIVDMFVLEESRKLGKGREIIKELSEIALVRGCEFISANIRLNDKSASQTLMASLFVGFKAVQADQGSITIILNLSGGTNG